MLNNTNVFSVSAIENKKIKSILYDIYEVLEEKGYNPVNQIVGYLMSGDPGYMSSYKDARSKILEIDRAKILITILEDFLNQ